MKLLTHYLHAINDSSCCYRFFYGNENGETSVAVWELIDLEKNEWKLAKEKHIHPSIQQEMENILYDATEEIKKVEKGENGFGSIERIHEIKKREDSISCKVKLKGIAGDMNVYFSFEEGTWGYSSSDHPNHVIVYVFHKNGKWSQDFVQELYNDKKLKLFFVTS